MIGFWGFIHGCCTRGVGASSDWWYIGWMVVDTTSRQYNGSIFFNVVAANGPITPIPGQPKVGQPNQEPTDNIEFVQVGNRQGWRTKGRPQIVQIDLLQDTNLFKQRRPFDRTFQFDTEGLIGNFPTIIRRNTKMFRRINPFVRGGSIIRSRSSSAIGSVMGGGKILLGRTK